MSPSKPVPALIVAFQPIVTPPPLAEPALPDVPAPLFTRITELVLLKVAMTSSHVRGAAAVADLERPHAVGGEVEAVPGGLGGQDLVEADGHRAGADGHQGNTRP